MPVILVLTITLNLPGYGTQTTSIERPMPTLAACEKAGRALVADNNDVHRFAFVCQGPT